MVSSARIYLGVLFSVASASAQLADDVSRADAAFEAGKVALDRGETASACARFAESQRLVPRGGTLANLGVCHAREGRLLLAWRELREALDLARRDGKGEREATVRDELASVEKKLGWVTVRLPAGAEEDVQITVGGEPAQAGVAVPVEPGTVVVVATARGREPIELRLSLREGQRENVLVTASSATKAPRENERQGPASSTLRTTALWTGIAGVAVGLVGSAWAWERKQHLRNNCPDKVCTDASDLGAADRGKTLAVVGTLGFAVGALGFGAYLLLPSGHGGRAAPAMIGLRGDWP